MCSGGEEVDDVFDDSSVTGLIDHSPTDIAIIAILIPQALKDYQETSKHLYFNCQNLHILMFEKVNMSWK